VELLRITTRARALVAPSSGRALVALVPVDLPSAAVDSDLLRVLGALYLAACFEAAGVIPAAEDLTRLARAGAIRVDLGQAADVVLAFWRTREERASEGERRALYADLFGMPGEVEQSGRAPNVEFEEHLLDLCEAIYRFAEALGNGVTEVPRLRRAVQRLSDNLQRATSGMTVMMAEDILKTQKTALELLNHDAIRAALHARDMWAVMEKVDRLLRRASPNRQPHVDRGRAGLTLLVWLASASQELMVRGPSAIRPDEAVVGAAVDWLEASLALGQAADLHTQESASSGASWADVAR
jgi:hypothetical protein